MKRSKKIKRKLASRIADWESMTAKQTDLKKAYRKPGSNT